MKHRCVRLLCLILALIMTLPSALAYEKLERGDINSDVLNMQKALKSLGYTLTADGNFGSGTERVVKAFQQRHGLKADGIAGNATLSLLYSLAPAYDPEGGNTSGGNSGSASTISGVKATVVTTGGSLNLRSSASSVSRVVASIPNGASITVTQVGSSWCAAYYNGYSGYVMTEFLRFNTSSSVTPTPVPSTGTTGGQWAKVVTSGGSLNLRAAARDSAAVKTTIPYGAQVYVTNRGSSWCAVTYNGYTGYVMTKFLSFTTSVVTASPVPTVAPTQKPSSGATIAYVQTTGGSLNLRAEAKSGAKVLTTIPFGTQLTIASVGSTWCSTYYNGYAGYVMTSFLRFVNTPSATTAPTPSPLPTQNTTVIGGETAYVVTSGGSLNLRAEAKSGSKVLTTIPNNTRLTVTNRGSSWCAVYYNGYSGYVMTSFLRFAQENAATPTPTPTPTASSGATTATYAVVTTSGGTLNLRASASTTAKVIASIPNGASLQVYSKGSSWCAVSYNGVSGYVMTSYLTFLSNSGTNSGGNGGSTNTDAPTSEEDSDPSKYKRTLKSGMTGEDVAWVQTKLEELGYSVTVTSVYDGNTISAVKAFQKQNGLDVDGLAGEQTFTILASDNARKASDAAISYTTLRIDDTKNGVTSLQKALKELGYQVTVNGEYDPETHNAVVAFQQRNSLVISGIADSLTQHVLYGSSAKPYSTYVAPLDLSGAYMAAPAKSEIQLLHWVDEIKPTVKAGQTITIYEPQSGLSWSISFYSLGRHADSQPTTWRDTQIMNVALGKSDWTVHPVYVKLPDGRWTMATMHNRPHLYGSITNNGFGGHLCIHFLRDMDEAIRNDPNYGVQNQNTLRSAWKALTGETVN